MRNEGRLAFDHVARLICPDCGGKLLRGPRALSLNQNLTCRDCTMRFNATIVDKTSYAAISIARNPLDRPRHDHLPRSDAEFMDRVAVVAFERIGPDPAGAAYYDPTCPTRRCEYEPCSQEFTGPAVYCCLCCAISDA